MTQAALLCFVAAQHGQIDVLDALIAHGADIEAVNYELLSSYGTAFENGHILIVSRLLFVL